MGFKAIKQHYDIKHIVAIYNEEKYGGGCIFNCFRDFSQLIDKKI